MSLDEARARLSEADAVLIFTGAGMSAESGIPTFRGSEGLWKEFRPEELATPSAFRNDPRLVWEWYGMRREMIAGCVPNPGHRAVARLFASDKDVAVVTQNVDDLHQRALRDRGLEPEREPVLQIHGSIFRVRCTACAWSDDRYEAVDTESTDRLPWCGECGALARPDVVWFGEPLDASLLDDAARRAEAADLCLVVGTSGVVEPAASLPRISAEHGADVIEVNPERTPLSDLARFTFRAPAGEVLPGLVGPGTV